jgi:predicted benzoate:H+ symporter BenE
MIVNRQAVLLIKSIHTVIFLFMSGAILYILYCGLTRTYNWTLAAAVGMVLVECAVYVLNGLRCPLTHLAQQYGDPTGNDLIADIFLPPEFARKIPPVCGGLFIVGILVLIFNYWSVST